MVGMSEVLTFLSLDGSPPHSSAHPLAHRAARSLQGLFWGEGGGVK